MYKYILLALVSTLTFIGCGGGSGSSGGFLKGFLIDSGVQGVQYTCGSISGKTGVNGEFNYTESCDIELKIGNILLGKISSEMIRDKRLYPSDLARVSRSNITDIRVRNVIRVLQSLDTDGDPSNGIQISDDTINKFSDIEILDVLESSVSSTHISTILQTKGFTLIDEATALTHYKSTLLKDLGIDPASTNTPSPSIYLNGSISESATVGTLVTTIPLTSIVTGNIASIQITGIGNGNFTAANDGTITVASGASLDYETKNTYNLEVVITEANKNQVTVSFTVSIQNSSNDLAPSLSFSPVSINENLASGTTVGTITVNDNGVAIKSITLSGTKASHFTVSNAGVITVAQNASIDYESLTKYELTATATNVNDLKANVGVVINVNDLNDVTLIFDPINSDEAFSTYNVTQNPPTTALTLNDKSVVKVGIYSSALKSYSITVINNLKNYYSGMGYNTIFYGTSGTKDRLTVFEADSTIEKIENLDMLIIMQPGQEFDSSEISILSKLLDKGGRIFFIGEHNNYSPVENANISKAVVALGGGVTVLGGAYSADNQQENTDSKKNLNYSVLLSGVTTFTTAHYAQLELKGQITHPIIVDDFNRILMAEQGLSKGRITLIADHNWFDTSKLSSNTNQNTQFLENLAISSYAHTQFVESNGNPNTQPVDYLNIK